MKPKPSHLAEEYAAQWEDACMAADYPARPPYAPEVFEILHRLARDGPVLDVGCGTGDVARPLARRGVRVDAVDRSAAMIAKGRTLPGGDGPNWILGRAEEAPLDPPYTLATAGECMAWLDWETIFPRLRAAAPRIALVFREEEPAPWTEGLLEIIPRHSTNTRFERYDLVEELESRGVFRVERIERAPVMQFEQPIEDYIASFHSRNGFSRERMGAERAAAFDAEVRELVAPHARDGIVRLRVQCAVKHG